MRDVLPDEEVVRRVVAGETELYELLVRRHNQRLFRTVRALVGNDAEAEDTLQTTYVRAWRALTSFEGRSSFITWITRIATRAAAETLARRGRRRDVEAQAAREDVAGGDRPGDELERGELSAWLERAIDTLSDTYRPAFVLRVVQGLPVDEVAAGLGVSAEVVRVRVHRAREKLKRDLLARAEREGAWADAWRFDGERCNRTVAAVFRRLRTELGS